MTYQYLASIPKAKSQVAAPGCFSVLPEAPCQGWFHRNHPKGLAFIWSRQYASLVGRSHDWTERATLGNLTVRVSKPYRKVNQRFSMLAYEPQGFSPVLGGSSRVVIRRNTLRRTPANA
jgi:hypothetical protein